MTPTGRAPLRRAQLGGAPRHRGILRLVTDGERDVPERRSGARRAALNAARPLVGYFDHRFQDLHDHLDRLRVGSHLDACLDQISALSRQTREEVAADADTIAELAFTLERFADLFTARMDEIAETMFEASLGGASSTPMWSSCRSRTQPRTRCRRAPKSRRSPRTADRSLSRWRLSACASARRRPAGCRRGTPT